MAKFFVVLAANGTEGYITNDPEDAELAASGFSYGAGCSSLATAFREIYGDDEDFDDEGDSRADFSVIEVEIEVA